MEIKISRELVSALKNLQGKISVERKLEPRSYDGVKYFIPDVSYTIVSVNLSEYSNPIKDIIACEKWMNILSTYYSTSCNTCRINIGPFKRLYPISIDYEANTIFFKAEDNVEYKPSWKDWFIVEGDINASELSIELLSDVRNS